MDLICLIKLINAKIIWSPFLIALFLCSGIYFTLRSGFLQIRLLAPMIKAVFNTKGSSSGISALQALFMAVSGTVGTGNIAGTAIAIYMGGPGALFWMWLIAFLGAASAFIEAVLAQLWKVEIDGEYRGGPAYYIEYGMGLKAYGIFFALAAIPCCGLLFTGLQANNIAIAFKNAWQIPSIFTGAVIALLTAYIIFGGIKRIAGVSQIAAPFMAGGYLILAFIIILVNFQALPRVLGEIFKGAFGLGPAFGGIMGHAIAWGIRRGTFSNEAGQGTIPHSAAATEVSHPVKQGLAQTLAVYIDTLFVCSATGFMVLLTDCYNVLDLNTGRLIINNLPQAEMGAAYVQAAISTVFHGWGGSLVAVFLGFFAFTSIPVYFYHAESNLTYLFNKKPKLRGVFIFILRAAGIVFVFLSAVSPTEAAWALGDMGVGIMAWINIIAIIILHRPALILLEDFEGQLKAGKDPVFNPASFALPNTALWRKIYKNNFWR